MIIKLFLLCLISFPIFGADVPSSITDSIASIDITTNDSKFNYNSSGSGILISYKTNNYFITNAHVCLGHYKKEVYKEFNDEWLIEDFNQSHKVLMRINSNNHLISLNLSLSEIKYHPFKDVCIIPIPNHITIKNPYILNNSIQIPKNNKLAFFYTYNKRNETDSRKLIKSYGMYDSSWSKNKKYLYTSTENQSISMVMTIGLTTKFSFKTIKGDSGSPVFNNQNELIGLVFATGFKQYGMVLPKESILELLK